MKTFASRRRFLAALLPLALAACGGDDGFDSGAPATCSVADQKAWLSSYFDDWYFWYRISPRPNPAGYATVGDYFNALLYTGTDVNFPADRFSRSESTESFNRFFGDGATNIGAFHEAVNFAANYQLPTIFVCENNLYMEYTSIAEVTPVTNPAADRAAAYGMEATIVDGNDADAVYLAAVAAIDKARAGGGPSIIESKTYRHGGHSRADPGTYRPEEEIAAWMAHDPIPMYHQRLLGLGVPEEKLATINQEIASEIDAATEAAKAAPFPEESALYTNVWANGGSAWRN